MAPHGFSDEKWCFICKFDLNSKNMLLKFPGRTGIKCVPIEKLDYETVILITLIEVSVLWDSLALGRTRPTNAGALFKRFKDECVSS